MASGINVSVEGLHGVASQLEDAAGALHGHADALSSISIPASAFGTFVAAHAQVLSDQEGVTTTVRGSADRTAGHGTDARSAAGNYVAGDDSGASNVSAVEV